MAIINEKKRSVQTYIALAVFAETAVNAVFSAVFDNFLNCFYSDYAHLTIWGDIAAIVSVVISFIIYDSFAHAAYKELRNRVMFLGVVYVASKAASIIHYIVAIIAELFAANAGGTARDIAFAAFEITVDVAVAAWLIKYFEKKFKKEENE